VKVGGGGGVYVPGMVKISFWVTNLKKIISKFVIMHQSIPGTNY
jgi:hypothetical protein